MRLPSRWVTNPGRPSKRRADLTARSALFLCPPTWEGDALATRRRREQVLPPRGREITTGLRPFAGGRECFLPLVPAHAEGAPRSGRRQQDTPPGREEEFTKGEKPPKKEGRGAGETLRRGGVGETVQGRRCRGETMQGRRCSTPGKSRTAHPRNKNHGLPENHDLPGKPGSP